MNGTNTYIGEKGGKTMNKKAEILKKVLDLCTPPIPCSNKCKHWKFPHLDRPCVLSEVFGAAKSGEPCHDYQLKEDL
jgi:hypothetical protein